MNGVSRCSGSSVTSRHTKRRRAVAQQRARHEARLGEHLEPVADPEHRPAAIREVGDRAHHRAEPRDHAGPEVVAVREPARQQDPGDAVEVGRLVPQDHGLGARDRERVDRVDVAVGAREQDDADAGRHPAAPAAAAGGLASPSASTSNASISGFDSSSPASRSTTARAAASSAAVDRQLHPPPDADVGDPVDPEVRQAALDGPALRVEDARAWASR